MQYLLIGEEKRREERSEACMKVALMTHYKDIIAFNHWKQEP